MEHNETQFDLPGKYLIKNGVLLHWLGDATVLTLPEGITAIGRFALRDGKSLEKVILPDTLISIGMDSFQNCTSLREVEFGNGLREIGHGAFSRCKSLESVQLPMGLHTLEENAFAHCKNLKSVSIPSGIKQIKCSTFKQCAALKEITLPEGVEEISIYAFDGCTSLERVTLPASLKRMSKAFFNCPSLKEVKLSFGGNVNVGWSVFYGCSNPLKVTFAGTSSEFKKCFGAQYDPPEYEMMYGERCVGKWHYPLGHPDADRFTCEAYCEADGVTVKLQGAKVGPFGD